MEYFQYYLHYSDAEVDKRLLCHYNSMKKIKDEN